MTEPSNDVVLERYSVGGKTMPLTTATTTDDTYSTYHPDFACEAQTNHISSDTEANSDNSESSRTGVIDYYPVASEYANRKSPWSDTIERCTENNDKAFDYAVSVDSDVSLESPRDKATVVDSACMNPLVSGRDVVIDMPAETAATPWSDYDEVYAVSDNEDSLMTSEVSPRAYFHGNDVTDRSKRVNETLDAQLLNCQRRKQHYDQRNGLSDGLSGGLARNIEMQELNTRVDRHLQIADSPPFESREAVENALSRLHSGEDSKSSEDSTKQETLKKKRKKRKTKSTSSLDLDNHEPTDENGNPTDLSTRGCHRPASTDLHSNYHNRVFDDVVSKDKSTDPKTKKKAKKMDKSDSITAEQIPGHQGSKTIEDLMDFIENNNPRKKKKQYCIDTSLSGSITAVSHLKKTDFSASREKKMKSKTPEPRDPTETDSTSSETLTIPDEAKAAPVSNNSAVVAADSDRSGDDGNHRGNTKPEPSGGGVDLTDDDDTTLTKYELGFEVVTGGKKKKQRSFGYSRDDIPDRRQIRSKTPPPMSTANLNYASKPPLPPSTPPPTNLNSKLEDRSLSPSAFPLLNGDVPSSGRRNSTGNVPNDLKDHGDGACVKSLLATENACNLPISYAKMAASPKPKVVSAIQAKSVESLLVKGNAKRNLDNALKPDDVLTDRAKSSSPPPRVATVERLDVCGEKARERSDTSASCDKHIVKTDESERKYFGRDHSSAEPEFPPRSRDLSRDYSASKCGPETAARAAPRDDEFPSLPRRASDDHPLDADKSAPNLSSPLGAHLLSTTPVTAAAIAAAAASNNATLAPLAAAGATTGNKAVIFLDDDNYSPKDLGISFVFDATLACEPPPELVAAVNSGDFKLRGDSPCSNQLSFIANNTDSEAAKTALGPVNGLVFRPREAGRGPHPASRYEWQQQRRLHMDNHLLNQFNIVEAVRFLQKEWIKIQEHKQNGTMLVQEYSED